MKHLTTMRGIKLPLLSLVFHFFGLLSPAHAQLLDPNQATKLWVDWMVSPPVDGPRFYMKTEREILQSSFSKAKFQNGKLDLILADGGIAKVWKDQIPGFEEEWDSDKDGWRDVVELDAEPPTDPFDPSSFPTKIAPDVYWTALANGALIPVDQNGSRPASVVRPFSSPSVILSAAPASSTLPRLTPFGDYSTSYYIVNPSTLSFDLFGLALYNYSRYYPNPTDVSRMEKEAVVGTYQCQFPTVSDPFRNLSVAVGHTALPNGSMVTGTYKRPTWIIRSAGALESLNKTPVPQKWVNGRLRFDPDVATNFKWDNIVQNNLANPQTDKITIALYDEAGTTVIWPPTGAAVVTSVGSPEATLYLPGLINAVNLNDLSTPTPPVNANLVLTYVRNVNVAATGDVSTVTLKVPIEMKRGYTSWRRVLFPGADGQNDSISGPKADPDKDGLTNLEEFNQGGDPRVPNFAIVNPTSTITVANPYSWTVTLGATIQQDPFSPAAVTVYERGVVYAPTSVNNSPLINGAGVFRASDGFTSAGPFAIPVTGLTDGTKYSYRGYAVTSNGTYYTQPVKTFTTPSLPSLTIPTVISPTSSNLTSTTATLGGNVTSDGGPGSPFFPLIERGVVYSLTSTNDNPFIGGTGVTQVSQASSSTGVFTLGITGLASGATYSFRAYAINSVGVGYTTSIGTFTTAGVPVVVSPTDTGITSTFAVLGGTVTSSGGSPVFLRGVVFSASDPAPVIGAAGVTAFSAGSTGLGTFTVNVTLTPATTYYYRAYAINAVGVGYTAFAGSFITPSALPTLANPTLSNITSTSSTLGAEVTSEGGAPVTQRGFVYSVTANNSNPVIGGPGVMQIVAAGGGLGVFSSDISPLLQNTGYTFKSYATNSAGTAYGPVYAFFTTLPPLTVILPTAPSDSITSTTAVLGGTVVSDQGTIVDERGVLYSSTNTDPQIGGAGVFQTPGTGTVGIFTVNVKLLIPNTLYYYRAYAFNADGTSYSVVSSFTTQPLVLPGLAQVEWVSESLAGAAFAPIEGAAEAEAQPRSVPRFVYVKTAAEMEDPLNYQILTSTDTKIWLPVDENLWIVEESANTLTATWTSADSPPANLFFRVEATVAQ